MDGNRNRGVSLIEILVIVAIITSGLLPVFSLFSETAKRVSLNEDIVIANLWAVQLIERYRMVSFEKLQARFSSPVDAPSLLVTDPILNDWWNEDPMTDKSRCFLQQFEVSLVFVPNELYPDRLGKLLCTVSWHNKQGKVRNQERILLVEKYP